MTIGLMLGVFAATVFAAPRSLSLDTNQCNTSNLPVINITFKVTNDADSGIAGNAWAYDNYDKHVQVWDQGNGTFCAIVQYEGKFVTIAGSSPSGDGMITAGITGSFVGGYQATFDGTLAPTTLPKKGSLETTYDYKCDTNFICSPYDWVGSYFMENTFFNQPYWSWTYHAGNNGSWVNGSTGNSGDITGK